MVDRETAQELNRRPRGSGGGLTSRPPADRADCEARRDAATIARVVVLNDHDRSLSAVRKVSVFPRCRPFFQTRHQVQHVHRVAPCPMVVAGMTGVSPLKVTSDSVATLIYLSARSAA
jgi:hypothetical protein